MARIRSIKPEFWTDEDLSELPPETHMLAAALLNHADDEGYFKANPRLVQATCCPLREDSTSIRRSLDELSRVGYIRLYEGPDGKRYGLIRNFTRHQKIDRPSPSKISPMIRNLEPVDTDSTRTRRGFDEDSLPEQGTGSGEQGGDQGAMEQGKDRGSLQGAHEPSAPAADANGNSRSKPRTANRFDEFWQLYPSRRGKKRAREIWQSKNLDARADEILHDVRERQRRDQRWLDGYVPNPTTYLNQERWEDEFGAPGGTAGSKISGVDRWLENQAAGGQR